MVIFAYRVSLYILLIYVSLDRVIVVSEVGLSVIHNDILNQKGIFLLVISQVKYYILQIIPKLWRNHPSNRYHSHRLQILLMLFTETLFPFPRPVHYNVAIMSAMVSQITGLTSVYSTVSSGTGQRKHQSSASLAFVREIHWWPVNSPHKGPVTRKMFPFPDVIMVWDHHVPTPIFHCWKHSTLAAVAMFPGGYKSLYRVNFTIY